MNMIQLNGLPPGRLEQCGMVWGRLLLNIRRPERSSEASDDLPSMRQRQAAAASVKDDQTPVPAKFQNFGKM